MTAILTAEAERAVESIGRADVVVGIPTFNNARTIGRVAQAVSAGLSKYLPQFRAMVVHSDSGSVDRTRREALSAGSGDAHLVLLDTPLPRAQSLSLPYHGIPGKDAAVHMIFEIARRVGAKACAVLDADSCAIAPEWSDLLLRPILAAGYDYAAPVYQRHKYDGGITNSILYPLTRALYGRRVRQPAGADFAASSRMIERFLDLAEWDSALSRYGLEVWLTTAAIAEGYRVCESYLGPKVHGSPNPPLDLSSILEQLVGSVFALMEAYEDVWRPVNETKKVEAFGFKFDPGLDPAPTNTPALVHGFVHGLRDLDEILRLALSRETYAEIQALAKSASEGSFLMRDRLWVRTVFDFACAHHLQVVNQSALLRSLTPVYLAWSASYLEEAEPMIAAEIEERTEGLCREFENLKPRLAAQ